MLEYFTDEMVSATWIPGGNGTYGASGLWVPATGTPSTIQIVRPQPVTSNDLQQLDDGEHTQDFLRTYTTALVDTREGVADSDVITWLSEPYRVVQVDKRDLDGGFRRVIMRRVRQ